MRAQIMLLLLICTAAFAFAEELIGNDTSNNTQYVTSPFADPNSTICIFLKEWVLKGVFAVIFLMFILGIAIMSGAAFPQWREKGGMMILGSVGAVILYYIGIPVLKLFMGSTICGL